MKNKIIAITGIAGSGKTFIAKKLSLDFSIDKVISLDLLLPFMKMVAAKNNKYLFTNTHSASEIENIGIIPSYLKHSREVQNLLSPYLDKIDDKVLILEGAQLTKDYLNSLKTKFDIICFNFYCSKEVLLDNYKKKSKIRKSNWLSHIDILLELQEYNKAMFNEETFFNNKSSEFYKKIKLIVKEFLSV